MVGHDNERYDSIAPIGTLFSHSNHFRFGSGEVGSDPGYASDDNDDDSGQSLLQAAAGGALDSPPLSRLPMAAAAAVLERQRPRPSEAARIPLHRDIAQL